MCTPADRGYLVGIKYVFISSLCLGTSSLPNMLNDLDMLEESGLFRNKLNCMEYFIFSALIISLKNKESAMVFSKVL